MGVEWDASFMWQLSLMVDLVKSSHRWAMNFPFSLLCSKCVALINYLSLKKSSKNLMTTVNFHSPINHRFSREMYNIPGKI